MISKIIIGTFFVVVGGLTYELYTESVGIFLLCFGAVLIGRKE